MGKERRPRAEREEPKTEPPKTVRQREGNRMSPMAGIRSRTPPPQGGGSRTIETASEQFDVHIKEKTPEEKSASSLKEVAREVMKKASAGALSVIGAAWKAQKMASSWNQAQGALTRVTQISRRRESCQTREGPGQRERGAAPGSQHRDEPEGQDGSCNLEEQRGELAREGSRTPKLEHSRQHREVALRQMQAEAREKRRPDLAGTARPREGNKNSLGRGSGDARPCPRVRGLDSRGRPPTI